MEGSTLFDKLVSNLSHKERHELLDKIRLSIHPDDEPITDLGPREEVDFGKVYSGLSIWSKIVLTVRVLFTGRSRVDLLTDIVLKRIGASIDRRAQSIFTTRNLEFGPTLAVELQALQASLRVFVEPLRRALGRDKRDFIAFLAGIEMPLVQEHLLAETDPSSYLDNRTVESEASMKRDIEYAMEATLEEITENDRNSMYRYMSTLHVLDLLARFPYDRINAAYEVHGGRRACSIQRVLQPAEELCGLLEGLAVPPDLNLLEALFLFEMREALEDASFEVEDRLKGLIASSNSAMAQIRSFNHTVPLVEILKFTLREIDFVPPRRGGGEDWFALFKQFWNERLEANINEFTVRRRRKELLAEATSFINLAQLPLLRFYRSERWSDGNSAEHEWSIAFLVGFINQVFLLEIYRTLKIFLVDGQFYKEQNRRDFNESYNRVLRVLDEIKRFDASLAPIEDDAHAPAMPGLAGVESPTDRNRVEMLRAAANREAGSLVSGTIDTFDLLGNLMDGILLGKGDSVFDTIVNRPFIGGRDNARLIASLSRNVEIMRKGTQLLTDLFALETGNLS